MNICNFGVCPPPSNPSFSTYSFDGLNRIACMSNSSKTNFSRGSLRTRVSPISLFFLGLPLLQGIFCWGERDSSVISSSAALPASASARRSVTLSTGRGRSPFGYLGMHAESRNKSQLFPIFLNSSINNNLINEICDIFVFS